MDIGARGVGARGAIAHARLEFSALGAKSETHCPLGLYAFPTPDILKWNCVIFIHRGYYANAILHFDLSIPKNYPSSPPIIQFRVPILHPLIHPSTGVLKITKKFPSWRPNQDFISNLLFFVKSIFKHAVLESLNIEDCNNMEAYRLYRDETSMFIKLVEQSALLSISDTSLYSPPPPSSTGIRANPSAIKFSKLDEKTENEMKAKVEASSKGKLVMRDLNLMDS